MQERKSKAKLQIVFSGLILALVFMIELYAMINLPDQFVVIGALGVVLLACLYVLIRAVMGFQAEKESRREEQYDSIFKSEKASYLMLKKYFEEIEEKLEVIEKLSKLPTEEITGTQKGIGKVIINRTRENAEAIINSNEIVLDEMKEIKSAIDAKNEALLGSCRSMNDDMVQQLLMKQQDLLLELKDMEIRLNNALMQSQKAAAPAAVYAAPVMPSVPAAPQAAKTPAAEEIIEDAPAAGEEMPAIEDTPVAGEEMPAIEDAPAVGEEMPVIEAPVYEDPVAEDVEPVVEEAEPVLEELESVLAEEPVVEEPAPAVAPAEPDLSDPNKQLSPDEIAALFASMDAGKAEEPAPAVEAAAPVVDEPAPAAAPEEPDLSDPNKQLSPDEIAALFASMSDEVTESAPEPPKAAEEPPMAPEVDLSDPNRQLSPDEIAALFSSMTS